MTQTPDRIAALRASFDGGRTRPAKWRRQQLYQLMTMIEENEAAINEALNADLGKSCFEARMTEVGTVLSEIVHTLSKLRSWMRPTRVSTPLSNQPGHSRIVHEPLGVVLIMAPWNYPFNLTLTPLIGAIAAGNCAVLKPSEVSANTSALLARLISAYLESDAFAVFEGGPEISTELLEQRFDHIFFTGSEGIGRIVMSAAARHLTPVTLELGGKSPCIITADSDLELAARRVAWGKFLNAGQTCIAPDYVMIDETVADAFVGQMRKAITSFFGADPKQSPDYSRLINERHFDRVQGLISGGDVAIGGETDRAAKYIAPTVLTGVAPEAEVMREEIFGPVLPVMTYKSLDDAIGFITARPKPLALYVFARSRDIQNAVIARTSSGGACINDVVMHLAVPDLPFGGVGASGMGAYHGRASFDTFSHARAVLTKSEHFDVPLRYPPFTKTKLRWLKRLQ
ncbi:aldehyde dehydrogenase (NAD+) [Hoeflea halophila]|uniref:Aldehyde dehydrogenase n=1 Tax=Hoeflea halophila TaxID=714899 RepID=A0A286HLC5_9HYPH|nr:aldehyde dehydrogenase family protein [Hoeflea halophila]SOE08605.1 aldehyde dehydrogenase (NAD+) [Hoeflea halophila]